MKRSLLASLLCCVLSCSNSAEDPADAAVGDTGPTTVDAGADSASTADADHTDAFTPQPGEPVMVHDFGPRDLAGGFEEEPCAQWTFNNREPLYINTVTLVNDGAFHHSNWLVVPESSFPGEDGYFDCASRGYSEVTAAIQGTVLFAQSTQSREEAQALADGIVIKIPPYSKVIGGLHLLNISTETRTTGVRMRLDLLHPRDVKTVVTPFRLSYYDLEIEPNGETRVSSECLLKLPYEDFTGGAFDMKLHWALPHYHELGNYFQLELVGGARDGEQLFELAGFNAEANGVAFAPPVDLSDVEGLRFTCGFNNPRDETIGWGIGDQEMCVMLGLVEGAAMFDASIGNGNARVGEDANGRALHEGPCEVTMLPKNAAQSMPSQAEIDAELYVPPSSGSIDDVVVIPTCEDTPADEPAKFAPTLTSIHGSVLVPSCAFSSCHGAVNPAYGLDLATSDGLHDRLLGHAVQHNTTMPLVAPGDADGSLLYELMSSCAPLGGVTPMPRNASTLLEPGLVAMVREWIEAGAQDN